MCVESCKCIPMLDGQASVGRGGRAWLTSGSAGIQMRVPSVVNGGIHKLWDILYVMIDEMRIVDYRGHAERIGMVGDLTMVAIVC